ncbi:MAG: hypothetical protein IKF36_01300 [Bacilli bacterium]|nr:hypothetical protein [Bacilli bacterium]
MEYGSKIEEKIEIIENFLKKYPTLILNSNRIERYPEECEKYEALKTAIDEEYKIVKKYYDYIHHRNWEGKLSEENFNKMKEFNIIGSPFGYSKDVETLMNGYEIGPRYAVYLVRRYGTTEKLFNKYRNGEELTPEENELLMYIIKPFHDIDLDEQKEQSYSVLVKCIVGGVNPDSIVLYSSKMIDEEIEKLSDYQKKVLKCRFGLDGNNPMTLEETGREFNVSRERVRQIDAKAVRSLRRIADKVLFIKSQMDDLLGLTKEEQKQYSEAEKVLFLSRDKEQIEKANEVIKSFVLQENGNFKTKESIELERTNQSGDVLDTKIEDLNLSVRTYNCLHRGHINTLGDLVAYVDVRKIRNFGKRSLDELLPIVHEYGYKLRFELLEELRNGKQQEVVQEPKQEEVIEEPSKSANEDDIDNIEKAIEETEKRIEEKKNKSKLLDEYIRLAEIHNNLKKVESDLDKEIKEKEEILRKKGFTYEKK